MDRMARRIVRDDPRSLSRRALLTGLAGLAGAYALACSPAPTPTPVPPPKPIAPPPKPAPQPPTAAAKPPAAAPAQSKPAASGGFAFDRYKGTTLRWMVLSAPWVDMLKANLSEFEQLTGIKVTIDSETWIEKLLPILTAGSDEVDFFMSNKGTYGLRFSEAGWYEEMRKFVDDSSLTAGDYAYGDFFQSALDTCLVDKKLVGLPTWADHNFYYYRKDKFQEAGVPLPDPAKPLSLEQFAEIMPKLTKRDKEQYGIVTRGGARALIPMWISWLIVYGGNWKDSTGNWALNSPSAIKSYMEYGRMLREWGPPGITEQTDLNEIFCQGKAASYINTVVITPTLRDKAKCGVADQVGVSVMPGGRPYFFSWYMSISPFTKKKEAAWMFIQWASGKKNNLRTLLSGLPPVRKSTWDEPEFKNSAAAQKDKPLYDAQQASIAGGVADWLPWVHQVLDARDAIGAVVLKAAGGASEADVRSAADKLVDQMKEIEKRK
ncbi:MAG: extracellular solute-binding protein [Chloroflexi bacterium]|nr:extracellular solute-binding protein [Chloroflexota bacterium]